MKIIFLDIDGVLTTTMWASNYREFNPVCTNGLLKLLAADDSIQIVISSTWRNDGLDPERNLYKQLNNYGLIPRLHKDWRTINLYKIKCSEGRRGHEIQDWLDKHEGEVDCYIILDDDTDMLESQKDSFINTSATNGFLLEHLDMACLYLEVDHKKVKWNTDYVECRLKGTGLPDLEKIIRTWIAGSIAPGDTYDEDVNEIVDSFGVDELAIFMVGFFHNVTMGQITEPQNYIDALADFKQEFEWEMREMNNDH
jgi:hypothetical protein